MFKLNRTGKSESRPIMSACLLTLGCALAFCPAAQADLRHLYSFNDNANDTIGDADGKLKGAASISDDGLLQLPGGNGDFLDLPGGTINIASYTDVTFEAWFQVNQHVTWARVFDFGDRTAPSTDDGYVYYAPQGGGNSAGYARFATNGAFTEAPHDALQTGQMHHLAFVIDSIANGGANTMSIYLNGGLQTTVNHSRSLSNVPNTFAYLGESLVNDQNLRGALDEFRIYDHALSLEQVVSSFQAGPTPPASIRLEVNTVTGSMEFVSDSTTPVDFNYYLISSEDGALRPSGWSSLSDQGTDAIGAETGESWDEATNVDEHELVELYLLGASSAANGERIPLGHGFDTSVHGPGQEGDLVFEFSRPGSNLLRTGQVAYITPDPLDGDYNNDLSVNAADYTVWRNLLGQNNPAADGDGDGVVDHDDYVIWKWNYGNSAGDGNAVAVNAQVPEPTTAGVFLAALLVSSIASGRRRLLSRPQVAGLY